MQAHALLTTLMLADDLPADDTHADDPAAALMIWPMPVDLMPVPATMLTIVLSDVISPDD